MNLLTFLHDLSLWGVFVCSVLIIVVLAESGGWLGRRAFSTLKKKKKVYTGPAVGATLGLLAFMLAFSFGSATSRYEERRNLVLNEANAVGTAYLRTDVLSPAHADAARCLLYGYVVDRLEFVRTRAAGLPSNDLAKADSVHRELWSLVIEATQDKPTAHTALLLAATNEVIDFHQERVTVGFQHQMPTVFWYTLYCLVGLTMLVGGYDGGVSGAKRSVTVNLSVAFAFAMVLTLVVALDRPSALSIVTQQPLEDVLNGMSESAAHCGLSR